MIRAGPENENAPVANRGASEDFFDGSKSKKKREGETVAPTKSRNKQTLPPIYGRMFRRRGELVRLAQARQDVDVDLDHWLRAMCDVLVFSPHGCDHDTFMRLATKMCIAVDEDDAMTAIHETERIRKWKGKQYQPMKDETLGELLNVTVEEVVACQIRTMKPIDETEDQAAERRTMDTRTRKARHRQKISDEERQRRQAIDRERRWRKGVVRPRHESLMQLRPWEAEGVSRRTWYRRRGTDQPVSTNVSRWHGNAGDAQSSSCVYVSGEAVPPPANTITFVNGPSVPPTPPSPVPSEPFILTPASPQAPPFEASHEIVPPSIGIDPVATPTVPAVTAASALSVTVTTPDPETVEDMVELWAERAAIMEYDGGFSRDEAEVRAWDDIKGRYGAWHNVNFWTQFLNAIDLKRRAA